MIARLVIAGTHSGVGKTTLTSGLIAALRQRGLAIQPFKVGPDYIDPSYHTLAAGRACRNLDTWMVPPGRVQALFAHAAHGSDLALIEGVMGIYDGSDYDHEAGSTAQVAKLLDAPVMLVLDCRSMARSAAALALGYQQFDRALPLAGFILNRVGSAKHGQGVAAVIEKTTGLPVLGWLPRDAALEIPERHLGLVPTAEPGRWHDFITAAAERVVRYLDLDRLLEIARSAPALSVPDLTAALPEAFSVPRDKRPVIAVARDEAFSFSYADNLELLHAAGAELVYFSPLRDSSLPPFASCIILSGGFPELYAGELAANRGMRDELQRAHASHVPIYAECGGLMYLTERLIDLDGCVHDMVGLLPGQSVMTRQLTLGYRVAQAQGDSWLFRAGETVHGHEFHFSVWEARPGEISAAYSLLPRDGRGTPRSEGACFDNLWASYVHLHFWAQPQLAARFVSSSVRHE